MSEFNLKDLEKISRHEELLDVLVEHKIIKESKFLKQIEYEKRMRQLQFELVKLQSHIIENQQRVLVIFEGRDAAGKGGTIKRIIQNINPKRYRVTALSKPTEREQNQWYFQRYFRHLPQNGEIVFFDRSWYNRAVVEPVFGFCTDEQHELFMQEVNQTEERLVHDGIVLIKFFLDISKDEQFKRLEDRKNNPLKQWKLGGLDKQAQAKWEVYTHYIDKMLAQTHQIPWIEIKTDEKKDARINCIEYLLQSIPGFESDLNLDYNQKIVKIHKK